MNNRSLPDRSLLIPIGIGLFSGLGILLLLVNVYLNRPQPAPTPEQAASPFQYLFLGTATSIPTLITRTPPVDGTSEFNNALTSTAESEAIAATLTAISMENQAAVRTPEDHETAPTAVLPALNDTFTFAAGKYDDTDARIRYTGDWTLAANTIGAYQNTLYVSTTIGDSANFTFAGRQLQVGYLEDADLGALRISIGGNEFLLNEATNNVWASPQFPYGVYTVIITHDSGDVVHLDYITILGSP